MSDHRAVHTNLDPMTGNCLDCGARREEIADNIFPTCDKIEGPHRLTTMLLRREHRLKAWHAENARQNMVRAEREVVHWDHEQRRVSVEADELGGSLEFLKAASMPNAGKTQGPIEAINANHDFLQRRKDMT